MVYTSDIAYLKMNHDEKEWLTNFLHSFPHFSFSFKLTNSTFNPDDTKYVEVNVYKVQILTSLYTVSFQNVLLSLVNRLSNFSLLLVAHNFVTGP